MGQIVAFSDANVMWGGEDDHLESDYEDRSVVVDDQGNYDWWDEDDESDIEEIYDEAEDDYFQV